MSVRSSRAVVAITTVLIALGVDRAAFGAELRGAGWREDFHGDPKGWEVRERPGVEVTRFRVEPGPNGEGLLVMEADNASSIYGTHLKHIDLQRTPILRWRWRVRALPPGADGRDPEKDDQAIAIYVSSGGYFRQRSITYRWETTTPVGAHGWARYVGGLVRARWFALRNQDDAKADAFFVEERNVANDFREAFGFVPEGPTISVSSNSQYTGGHAAAELDWIELLPAPTAAD
jgi:hypothetical protein